MLNFKDLNNFKSLFWKSSEVLDGEGMSDLRNRIDKFCEMKRFKEEIELLAQEKERLIQHLKQDIGTLSMFADLRDMNSEVGRGYRALFNQRIELMQEMLLELGEQYVFLGSGDSDDDELLISTKEDYDIIEDDLNM